MMTMRERIRFFDLMSRYTEAGMTVSESLRWIARDMRRYGETLLTLSKQTSMGKQLSVALEQYSLLEDRYIMVIRQGEISGKVPDTFRELRILAQDIEVELRKSLLTLMKPVAYMAMAFSIFVGFLVFVFPIYGSQLPASSKGVLFQLSDSVNSLLEQHGLLVLGGFIGVFLWSGWALSQSKARAWILDATLDIPYVKNVAYGFLLATWARYASLALNSGITLEELFKQLNSILPDRISEGLSKTLSDAARLGWHNAMDIDKWDEQDSRHDWPIDFCASLRLGGVTGNLDTSTYRASVALLDSSKRDLLFLTGIAEKIGIIFVAIVVLVQFLALMMAQVAAIRAGM
ncbi:TPA: type II secretion system F family protein [Aeromonas veronii]